MRILPDNPNLDYLRQEAKQLLAALRENQPNLQLADAQRAVAEQYGLRTWTDLKTEVERRRSGSAPTDPGLATKIAELFDLGRPTGPMTPVAYAFMGRRWRLQTDQGDFLVGPVFDWIDAQQAATAVELRERARAAGVVAPEPMPTREGDYVAQAEGENWRADRWLDVGPEVLEPVRASLARTVGTKLAILHGVGMPTDRTLQPGSHGHLTYRHTADQWQELVDRTHVAGAPWFDDLVRLRQEVLVPLEKIPFRQPVDPFRICINDLNIAAVRMGPADELVFMHWDFAGPNVPEWELAYVLKHWASGQRANPGTARAIVDGYREVGAVPTLDRSSFWLPITAELNWTHDQFDRALGNPGEKQEFSVGAVQEMIEDSITPATIDALLAELT